MNKRNIAKSIVNHMTNFVVGSATTNVLRNSVPRTNNIAANVIIDVSLFVSSFAVSGTILKPVRNHTDEVIDDLADAINDLKKD